MALTNSNCFFNYSFCLLFLGAILSLSLFLLLDNNRYVQRRSELKDYCPGELDPVFGGCVGEGETYEENAVRELEEELGVSDAKLEHLFTFFYDGSPLDEPSIWGDVWETEMNMNIDELQLQPEEVEEVFLMLPAEIIGMDDMRNEETPVEKRITKDSVACLRMYVERRRRGGGERCAEMESESGSKSKY